MYIFYIHSYYQCHFIFKEECDAIILRIYVPVFWLAPGTKKILKVYLTHLKSQKFLYLSHNKVRVGKV